MQGWDRHLEGWQLAVVIVGSAVLAVALAIPRAVSPSEIPLPQIDRGELRRAEGARRAAVDAASTTPLPFPVRAVGEALRRFGRAEAEADVSKAKELAAELATRVREARAATGDAPLLVLRDVQTDLFVRAVEAWTKTGTQGADIAELGGAFAKRAVGTGWVNEGRLALDGDALAAIFEMRWTKLTGLLDVRPFSPSLNDWRVYYGTLIARPDVREADDETLATAQSTYVSALAKRDPDYPELLARGILDFRLGRYPSSAEALSEHLRLNPGGPWWLRARNYLVAARRLTPASPEEP